jgi:hypothetical protein
MSKSEISEQQKTATQWPDLVGQLFDRLTGKEAVIIYSFRSLEVEIPRAAPCFIDNSRRHVVDGNSHHSYRNISWVRNAIKFWLTPLVD